MNKTFLLSYLLLIGLQTSKIKAEADDSAEEVTINADTTEPFTEQQVKFCHANNGNNANKTFLIFRLKVTCLINVTRKIR